MTPTSRSPLAASTTVAVGSIVTTLEVMRSLTCGIPLASLRKKAVLRSDACPYCSGGNRSRHRQGERPSAEFSFSTKPLTNHVLL